MIYLFLSLLAVVFGACCLAGLFEHFFQNIERDEHEDICGICGKPGADKMALWTGGGVYWPGEFIPDTEMVHQSCEQEETRRAHAVLTQKQRDAVLRSI